MMQPVSESTAFQLAVIAMTVLMYRYFFGDWAHYSNEEILKDPEKEFKVHVGKLLIGVFVCLTVSLVLTLRIFLKLGIA